MEWDYGGGGRKLSVINISCMTDRYVEIYNLGFVGSVTAAGLTSRTLRSLLSFPLMHTG